jgi:CRISPR-associated endonuclease/helicase Cas3
MDDLLQETFRQRFTGLTGNASPFAWQEGLFAAFFQGSLPARIDLPTGSGKTSVMAIWLLALAAQAEKGAVGLPRRLVWVVDRRVVVDQATEEADRLADRLGKEQSLAVVRNALAELCYGVDPGDSPLVVSTLRGEREDNREWSQNPTRPAIVVGTVDMVGSRLLFSGYGDSRRRRALHAGLLGQDTLIVNDEAHLTPAFAALLCRVAGQLAGSQPMRAMLLSATQRDSSGEIFPASLDQDLADGESEFARRYRAVKRLRVLPPVDKAKDEMRNLALKPDRRTIVFVRRPEDARDLAAAIKKEHNQAGVPLITGTQRGYERDRLPFDETFKRFLSKDPPSADAPPCWLVATSAGEVGVDLSADRLITDLDTADHLLQRFGRLNRFGETEGDAYVVYPGKQLAGEKEDAERFKATVAYLHALDGSVSPESLRKWPPPAEAISKAPSLAPLLPWLVDVWSLTSVNAGDWPSRPVVAPWLHGDAGDSAPETYVVWRKDVEELADPRSGVPSSDIDKVFDCYPVLARERLKQYTDTLCNALKESAYLGKLAVLITADGEAHAATLEELLERRDFPYATLVLPPGVGFLDASGMVDWLKPTDKLTADEIGRYDVADLNGERERVRAQPGQVHSPGLRLRCTVEIAGNGEDEEGPRWLYFSGTVQKRNQLAPEPLANHHKHVAAVAAELGRRLGFGERLVRVFQWAGIWHDQGKDRPLWQREAGNRNGGPALAKSLDASKFNGRRLGGYRHELGSLLDAETQLRTDFTTEESDLALHLIAAHHGWARPHFPDRAYDKIACHRSRRAALESARRFGRLHQRYGAWHLAYLEAIFHSADAIASASMPELPPDA